MNDMDKLTDCLSSWCRGRHTPCPESPWTILLLFLRMRRRGSHPITPTNSQLTTVFTLDIQLLHVWTRSWGREHHPLSNLLRDHHCGWGDLYSCALPWRFNGSTRDGATRWVFLAYSSGAWSLAIATSTSFLALSFMPSQVSCKSCLTWVSSAPSSSWDFLGLHNYNHNSPITWRCCNLTKGLTTNDELMFPCQFIPSAQRH